MLGAVRDHGQIPWDYDADVVIPFYEKDRLISSLNQDLNDSFYFCSSEDDPHYYPSFIRIVPKGYPHDMLHVDVFYVIGIPDNEPERSTYIKAAREQYNKRKYAVINPFVLPGSMKSKAKITALKMITLLKYGKKNSKNEFNEVFGRYDPRLTRDSIIVSVRIGKLIYPSHIFQNTISVDTIEGKFDISADYEDFFKVKYGSWKEYLPIESRIAEVERHCKQFKWYQEKGMIPADAPHVM